jgi:anthranilate phosphoribosyltransferase
VLNSAGALIIGGRADSFADGIRLAGELIDSGEAKKKLERLIEASNDYSLSEKLA